MKEESKIETIFCHKKKMVTLQKIRESLHLLKQESTQQNGWITHEEYLKLHSELSKQTIAHLGVLPPIYPEALGSQSFIKMHDLQFPYVVGEMANGIATALMVVAAGNAGMLGFFGAAGLMPHVIEKNIDAIKGELRNKKNWGINLIHSPHEPYLEERTVQLFIKHEVKRVSASAFLSLTLPIVEYACKGITIDQEGKIKRSHHVFAKISRPEIAKLFLSPPPHDMLTRLVQTQKITATQAKLASYLPIAENITVESDSGGHTDNRPLVALFPTIRDLADKLIQQYGYTRAIHLGAAGGLGTPAAVCAAFNLGADYVLTGSINQSALESGLSTAAKNMLMEADIADVTMAPAADMFELGVKLQVLKRGCLFPARANKLYEIYRKHDSLESIPSDEKINLEKNIFQNLMENVWHETKQFFLKRDPNQIAQAEKNPKYRMALVFRWYLGLSSQWAIDGNVGRKVDYQIWCGPAMGAFNHWIKGTFLENLSERTVSQIGRNLLEGAAIISRAQQLRSFGLPIQHEAFSYVPQRF